MDCAYVEPNEPQMIDIMFIRSEYVRATCFFGKWLISLKNLHGVLQLAQRIVYLCERFAVIGWAPRWSRPKDVMETPLGAVGRGIQ